MTTLTAPSAWLQYFRLNSAEPALPWNEPYRLSGAERTVVIASIQQFQLGENAEGRRMLRRAERTLDPEYVDTLRLFIKEEQRHSRILARFLGHESVPCLKRHWIHGAFRMIRGLAGVELCMRVLSTAEVIAIPYYTALRDATCSPLLRAICQRILDEESAHLRFQSFTFARFSYGRSALLKRLSQVIHRWFLAVVARLVWLEHQLVFRAGGYTHARLQKECRTQYDAMCIAYRRLRVFGHQYRATTRTPWF